MKKLILLVCYLNAVTALAHDTDKAYYKVLENDTETIIHAKFPWTLRKSVLKFKPTLKNTKDTTAFENGFFEYVEYHLIVKNLKGEVLPLKSVKVLPTENRSHQSDYQFTFDGLGAESIKNSMMFNVKSNHKNIHKVSKDNYKESYITTADIPVIQLTIKDQQSNWWLILLIGSVLFIYVLISRKR
ncbi:hypothetical protein KH5_17620 [Urechidicola sp. KH5]